MLYVSICFIFILLVIIIHFEADRIIDEINSKHYADYEQGFVEGYNKAVSELEQKGRS